MNCQRCRRVKIVIEIDCDDAALHDDFETEFPRLLNAIPQKIFNQLERSGRCICEALESDDKLLDINGNTVGRIKVFR